MIFEGKCGKIQSWKRESKNQENGENKTEASRLGRNFGQTANPLIQKRQRYFFFIEKRSKIGSICFCASMKNRYEAWTPLSIFGAVPEADRIRVTAGCFQSIRAFNINIDVPFIQRTVCKKTENDPHGFFRRPGGKRIPRQQTAGIDGFVLFGAAHSGA